MQRHATAQSWGQRVRTLAVSLSVLLIGTMLYAQNARAQTATLPSTGTIAVPTYESAGLYWQSPGGTAGCEVRYRRSGESAWKQGLAMWYDARDSQCRGSLVGLEAGTWYQAELNLPGEAATRGLVFQTWSNGKPIAKTVAVNGGSAQYTITEGGTASGWVVYEGNGATLDGANSAQYNILVKASYVIIRGLNLKGARQDAIRLDPTVHDIVIEDNDISGWGRTRDGTWATNLDSGIRGYCSSQDQLVRVTIQRNRIHDPRYGANSWSDGHPAGAQAVTFSHCGGQLVVRHNEMYSTTGRYFNDVIGGEDNFTKAGFPNADSDIYGNRISHAWDDGIESEGANENVRIWGNYIDRTAIGIATTATSVGPAYVFRNVWNRAQMYAKVSLDLDDRQPFFKSGSDSSLGYGRRYFFHNTMLQATQAGLVNGLGGGFGMGGTGSTQLIQNTISMNNIYHLWKPGKTAFYQSASSSSSSHDMYNGAIGDMVQTGGINATPTYAAGNGWASEANGLYALAAGTAGYDAGARIANFNDSFSGTAPDVGAHEGGSSAMGFGVAASPGSAVGGASSGGGGGGGGGAVTLSSVVSRKTHGSAGTFDITVDSTQPITSSVTIEPRQIGAGHKVVFTFSGPVTSVGSVSVLDVSNATIGSATASAVGNTVEVTITGVPDAKRVRVSIGNVNGAGVNASASIGFLVGDVNGSRSVTSADVNRLKGKVGSTVTSSTFLYDVTASGAIDASDLSATKLRSGLSI